MFGLAFLMNPPDYKYKRVPVVLETFSDLETPLSVYLKLADGPYSIFSNHLRAEKSGDDTQLLGYRRKQFLPLGENKLKS